MSDSRKFRTIEEKIRYEREMAYHRERIKRFFFHFLLSATIAALLMLAISAVGDHLSTKQEYAGAECIDPGIYYKEPKKTDRVYPKAIDVVCKKTSKNPYGRNPPAQYMSSTSPKLSNDITKGADVKRIVAEMSTPEWWRNKFRDSIRIYVMPMDDVTMKYYNEYLFPEYAKGNRDLLCISDWMEKNQIYSSESEEGQKFMYRWSCFLEDTKRLRNLDKNPSHVIVNAIKNWDDYFPEERK